MRGETNAGKVRSLMEALGARATGPGRVYLTGGATAVLLGWRDTTVDVDLKLDPEPAGAFEAIAAIKEQLDINVELAAPDQFIPPVPGWEDRSRYIATHGSVSFYHYDPIGQALAKLERGHARDLSDVRAMVERELIEPDELNAAFAQIRSALLRYPSIDADAFEAKVREFVTSIAER